MIYIYRSALHIKTLIYTYIHIHIPKKKGIMDGRRNSARYRNEKLYAQHAHLRKPPPNAHQQVL